MATKKQAAQDAANMEVIKITLSTGKVVLIRESDLKDEEIATKNAGKRAGENMMAMGMFFITELTKLLIVEIDGQEPTATERLSLIPKLLTTKEFKQVRKVVGQLEGEDTAEPQIDFELTGQQ